MTFPDILKTELGALLQSDLASSDHEMSYMYALDIQSQLGPMGLLSFLFYLKKFWRYREKSKRGKKLPLNTAWEDKNTFYRIYAA